ncbi:LapA family protein [Streptomyces polygonati]|uniref:LapA family protein n=1 Tax=Streptomyces polygonati TaxID=1617087 RepID=A0ABV8HL38_9ACTN
MSSDKSVGGRSFRELMTPTRIAALVLIALAAIFIFENTRMVRIRLIIPEVTMRLWAALLIAFGIGLLTGLCLRFSARRRRR